MAGKVANGAYTDLLSTWLAGGTPPSLRLRLFTNNHTPAIADVPSDYTECAATGYAAAVITTGNWTVSTVSGVVQAVYIQVTFIFSTSATIYGYYVTDSVPTKVEWAELAADGPYAFGAAGGSVQVSLKLLGPSS